MGRIVIWIVGLALLSIVYVAAIHFKADEIEYDLNDRSNLALVKNNISWADVAINGRDAVIKGLAPDLASIESAKTAIQSVWGIRIVECQCQVSNKTSDDISDQTSLKPTRSKEQKTALSGAQDKSADKPVPNTETLTTVDMNKENTTETNNDIAQCQDNIDDLLGKRTIEFDTGSSTISDESIPLLKELVAIIRNCPDKRIKIAGHTDNVGTAEKNITLSLDRAEAVTRYFTKNGISANRLKAVGYGDSSPLVSNDTEEGRKRNRRIEFHITP